MGGTLEGAVCDPLRPAVQGCELSTSRPAGRDGAAASGPDRAAFTRAIGHEFARPELLAEALTHPSAPGAESGRRRRIRSTRRGYERLEFLGDRVLGLVVADMLWRRFGDEGEGLLTRRLTHLVRRRALTRVAQSIGLGAQLSFSPAEAAGGAARNPAILADACEAVIAAIYLDGGFDAAAAFVRRLWEPLLDEMEGPPRDPKTALQEWAQARGLGLPRYELIATNGPDHALLFTVAASVCGHDPAIATASAKRAAEAGAAELLLARLGGSGSR